MGRSRSPHNAQHCTSIWWIARKRKKIAIGGYKFGGFGTIATPSLGVYAVGAMLADLILVV